MPIRNQWEAIPGGPLGPHVRVLERVGFGAYGKRGPEPEDEP